MEAEVGPGGEVRVPLIVVGVVLAGTVVILGGTTLPRVTTSFELYIGKVAAWRSTEATGASTLTSVLVPSDLLGLVSEGKVREAEVGAEGEVRVALVIAGVVLVGTVGILGGTTLPRVTMSFELYIGQVAAWRSTEATGTGVAVGTPKR